MYVNIYKKRNFNYYILSQYDQLVLKMNKLYDIE